MQRRRDAARNPGPGRPRKHPAVAGAAVPRRPPPAPPQVVQQAPVDLAAVQAMTPEESKKYLTYIAKTADRYADKISAAKALADQRLKEPDPREDDDARPAFVKEAHAVFLAQCTRHHEEKFGEPA